MKTAVLLAGLVLCTGLGLTASHADAVPPVGEFLMHSPHMQPPAQPHGGRQVAMECLLLPAPSTPDHTHLMLVPSSSIDPHSPPCKGLTGTGTRRRHGQRLHRQCQGQRCHRERERGCRQCHGQRCRCEWGHRHRHCSCQRPGRWRAACWQATGHPAVWVDPCYLLDGGRLAVQGAVQMDAPAPPCLCPHSTDQHTPADQPAHASPLAPLPQATPPPLSPPPTSLLPAKVSPSPPQPPIP